MFNVIFNDILSYIVVLSLLMKEAEVPEENYWPTAIHWQTLSHNGASTTPRHERDSNSQR
jgi:hypothetical protein